MAITSWVVWGPGWGRAGLSALSPGMEKRIFPHPGDIGYSWGIDRATFYVWKSVECADGFIDLYSVKVLPFAPAIKNDAALKWAGQTAYANTYVYAPGGRTIELDVAASQTAEIFCNGAAIARNGSSSRITLVRGWNRLLIKTLSPSSIRGGLTPVFPENGSPGNWTLRVRLKSGDAAGLDGIQCSASDPQRATNASFLRYETTLTGQNGERPLFVRGDSVSPVLRILAGSGIASNLSAGEGKRIPNMSAGEERALRGGPSVYTQPFSPGATAMASDRIRAEAAKAIAIRLCDIDGKMILERKAALSFTEDGGRLTAQIPLFTEKLSPGHYSIAVDLLTADGSIQVRDGEHCLAVVWGPVNTNIDSAPRILGSVGHWLADVKPVEYPLERLSWLSTVGVLRHLKISQSWKSWGVSHDGKGNVTIGDAPVVDALIAHANKLGIALTGDLEFGYIKSDPKRSGQDMALTEGDADAVQRRAKIESQAEGVVLVPYGAAQLPPYGSPEFEKTLYDYAYKLVSKYRDRVHRWCGDNEIDLHAGSGTPAVAAVYAHASRILYRAMKDADPTAEFITASLVRDAPFVSNLFLFGYGANADLIDVHAHPYRSPRLTDTLIGNSPKEGLGAIANYLKGDNNKPVIYGEFSSPLAHSPDGAYGQAAGIVKQIAWALKQPNIRAMYYLILYSSGACLGFCNTFNDPLPANNTINVVSHLLDGRRILADVPGLPPGVQQIRTDGSDGLETLVLWSEESPSEIAIPCRTESAAVIDIYGRETWLRSKDGSLVVMAAEMPVFIRGKFK